MNEQQFSYPAMGTIWKMTVWDEISDTDFDDLQKEVVAMTEKFDETYSRFKKTSLVWSIADKTGVVEVPKEFVEMLKLYRDLYESSGKKLNPLIGNTISDLGYDAEYSLVKKDAVRATPDLLETVRIVDDTHIEVKEPVLFDFGALGKGYFVDRIADFLKEKGIERYLVDGSGDIFYCGSEPIQVGLEHPEDPTKVIGKMDMTTGAMCSSGTNRRKWGKYNHVIDPHTSESPEEIIATWVMADTAALADALATCLFFGAPENFSNYRFEYCVMNSSHEIKYSANFGAEYF